ncbi:hypothetical protein [Streptomyces olivaceoviridis]
MAMPTPCSFPERIATDAALTTALKGDLIHACFDGPPQGCRLLRGTHHAQMRDGRPFEDLLKEHRPQRDDEFPE